MRYARIDNGLLEHTIAPQENSNIKAQLIRDGFVPYEMPEKPEESSLTPIESYTLKYRDEGDKIVGYYGQPAIDPQKVERQIARIKAEIAETDYKVTKNQECQMAGVELAYDPQQLFDEREAKRVEIRELEQYLL